MESNLKITEKTLLSLNVVMLIIGMVVWNIRLNDRVDRHEEDISEIKNHMRSVARVKSDVEMRLYVIEDRLKIKRVARIGDGEH
jgi:hypothetical protein